MKILIAGYGYVGKALAKDLTGKGWGVYGLRRTSETAEGISVITADLLDVNSLKNLPAVDHVLFSQSPSQKTDNYEKTYVEATRNLLSALKNQALKKVIFISSTGVYGEQGGGWVDEKTPPDPKDENGRTLLKAEETVLKSGFPAVVLRLSGIYGPGRNRVKSLKDGRVKPVFSDAFMNRVHIDDIVSAINLLLDKGEPGKVYLASDDEPSTEREFYTWLKLEGPLVSSEKRGKRCSNKGLKGLGWAPKYPSFREGYLGLE